MQIRVLIYHTLFVKAWGEKKGLDHDGALASRLG